MFSSTGRPVCPALRSGFTSWLVVELLWLHALWMCGPSLTRAAEDSACPIQCICVENRMNCEKTGLKRLPPPFRVHLETLHVANQTFDSTRLGPGELAVYTSPEYGGQVILKKLFIRFCNIKSIEPKAFQALGSTLEMVDLTGNPLIHVGAYAFAGLGPLTVVLDHIEQPDFDNQAFEDCRLKSLMMQYSNLTSLPIQPLLRLAAKGRLEKLLLRGNRFRYLDEQSQRLFDELAYFELDENPWHCDCQLTWLIRRYRQMLESRARVTRHRGPQSDASPEINQPRCASPPSLIGRKFTDLITDLSEVYSPSTLEGTSSPRRHAPPTIMYCPPPQIERLDINLEQFFADRIADGTAQSNAHPSAQLRCAVRGSPQLSVVWRYHHPGMGPTNVPNTNVTQRPGQGRRSALSSHANFEPWLENRYEAETQLMVEKTGDLDIYSCLGQDAIGNVSALVRIQWPPKPTAATPASKIPSSDAGLSHADSAQSSGNQTQDSIASDWSTKVLLTSQSMLHAPQFSLSQLLGAIAGTFLSTVLLFFLVHRTLHCHMTDCARQSQYSGEKPQTNLIGTVGVSPAGTSSSNTSSSHAKLVPAPNFHEACLNNVTSVAMPMHMNPEALSLTANLLNAHAYHQLMNGGMPNMSGHQTLPVSMGHGNGFPFTRDQPQLGGASHEDGSASQSVAYEPVTYSDAKGITYDVPWMVNMQRPSQSRPAPNEQHIPLLLSGMLTDVNRYAETPVSSHPGLIQSALMIPPPPPIPQPSLPPSAHSSLTLTTTPSSRHPPISQHDGGGGGGGGGGGNLFALQASGYPYPGMGTNSGMFESSASST